MGARLSDAERGERFKSLGSGLSELAKEFRGASNTAEHYGKRFGGTPLRDTTEPLLYLGRWLVVAAGILDALADDFSVVGGHLCAELFEAESTPTQYPAAADLRESRPNWPAVCGPKE